MWKLCLLLFVLSLMVTSLSASCTFGLGDYAQSAIYEIYLNYTLMYVEDLNNEKTKKQLGDQYNNGGLEIIDIP